MLRHLEKPGREQYFNSKRFLDNLKCIPQLLYLYSSYDYTYILYDFILLLLTEFWKQLFSWERLKPTNFQWYVSGRAIFSFTLSREYLLDFHLSTTDQTLSPPQTSTHLLFLFPYIFLPHTQFFAVIGKKLKCIPHRNRINKRQVHKRKPLGHWLKYFPMNLKKITGTCLYVFFHPWKL